MSISENIYVDPNPTEKWDPDPENSFRIQTLAVSFWELR